MLNEGETISVNQRSFSVVNTENVVESYVAENVDNFEDYVLVETYLTSDTGLTTYIYEYDLNGFNHSDRIIVQVNEQSEIACVEDYYLNLE